VHQIALSHVWILASYYFSPSSLFSAANAAAIAGGVIVAFLSILACIGAALYYRQVEAKNAEQLSIV
jgi:hypothetical protein